VRGQRRKGRGMADVIVAPMSVIARQMFLIRDDFIADLFAEMKPRFGG
jgi:hypothetical protein